MATKLKISEEAERARQEARAMVPGSSSRLMASRWTLEAISTFPRCPTPFEDQRWIRPKNSGAYLNINASTKTIVAGKLEATTKTCED